MEKSSKKFVWSKVWSVTKAVLGYGWKLALVVIALSFVGDFVDDYYWRHDRKFLSRWEYVKYLSNDICVKKHNGKYVQMFYRKNDKKVSKEKFRNIYDAPEDDSIAVFVDMDGKRGYLNANTGDIVLPAEYKHAWVFGDGVAAVVSVADDSLRFIDRNGNLAIDKAFPYLIDYGYVFHDSLCIMTDVNDDKVCMGIIDLKGEWVVPQKYSEISMITRFKYYKVALRNESGYREGLLDNDGNWIFQPEYKYIEASSYDKTFFVQKDYVKQHVSIDGTVLEPFVIDYMRPLEYDVLGENPVTEEGEGYIRTATSTRFMEYGINNLCGIFDLSTGRPLTDARYSHIHIEDGGIIRCGIEGGLGGNEVVFDRNGRKVQLD